MNTPLDIDALLSEVITLPSMPSTLARITEMMEDDASLTEVARVISSDPGIAMKALRLVNSAHYGLRQQVGSIEHAVVMLGARVVKNLVLTATVFETVKNTASNFLLHSVSCGVALRVIVAHVPVAGTLLKADEAFVLGLFHDVGKIVLGEFLPGEMARVQQLAHAQRVPWFQAERQIIGTDHAELGGRLGTHWKLPEVFVEAISGHHDLSLAKPAFRVHAAVLALANYLCNASGLQCHPGLPHAIPDETWELLALDSRGAHHLCLRYFEALPEVKQFLSLAR